MAEREGGALSEVGSPSPATPAAKERKADLTRLKGMVTECQSLTEPGRKESVIDIDFYDGHQFTADEIKMYNDRNQIPIVVNRVKPAVDGILGVMEKSPSLPRAYPRQPVEEEKADIATSCLRFIVDDTRFARTKLNVAKDIMVPGTGAVIVEVDDQKKVLITQIRWEEFIYDPRSRRPDFKDARYMGIAKWRYVDDVQREYPDADVNAAFNSGSGFASDESFQDRPDGAIGGAASWVDPKNRRLMFVELYHLEGDQWWRSCFLGTTILEQGPSGYLDERKRPENPIVAQSAYVDRKNQRYGKVRDMRGPQQEVNHRRGKSLHLLSTRQVQVRDQMGMVTDVDVARKEAARPDGVLPPGFEFAQNPAEFQGNLDLMNEAKAEMERQGPNPAVLGRDNADQSGRALLARQAAGQTELAPIFGAVGDFELRVARQCWYRAKQFWTDPMWIRVSDDEDAPKYIQLNQPVMQQAMAQHPTTGQPVPVHVPTGDYTNGITDLDVDINIESTPDSPEAQADDFQAIMQLFGSPAAQNPMALRLALTLMPSLSGKVRQKALDMLDGASQQPNPAEQAKVQLAAAQARAANSTADLNEAKTHDIAGRLVADLHSQGIADGQAMGGDQPPPAPQAPPVDPNAQADRAHDLIKHGLTLNANALAQSRDHAHQAATAARAQAAQSALSAQNAGQAQQAAAQAAANQPPAGQ